MAWKVITRLGAPGLDSARLWPPRTSSTRFPRMHKLQNDHTCEMLTSNQLLWSKVPQSSHQGQESEEPLSSVWLCAGVRLLARAGPWLFAGGAVPTTSGGEAGVGMGSTAACTQEVFTSCADSTHSHLEACQVPIIPPLESFHWIEGDKLQTVPCRPPGAPRIPRRLGQEKERGPLKLWGARLTLNQSTCTLLFSFTFTKMKN